MEIIYDIRVDENKLNIFDFDYKQLVESVIIKALDLEMFSKNVEVSFSLVDNEEIKQLNNYFRGKDYATDVLSFPLIDNFDNIINMEYIPLGDIVISIDKTIEQAKEYNHSIKREFAFLVVHSILHLLGYDHMTEVEEKEMFEKQEIILNEIGVLR